MFGHNKSGIVGQVRQLVHQLGVPAAGDGGDLLAFGGVRRERLRVAGRVLGQVYLTGPDDRQAVGAERLGERPHRPVGGLGRYYVDPGDAQRPLGMAERVLHVDQQQRAPRRVEGVDGGHVSVLSIPRTPARAQFSFGNSWITTCSPDGSAWACSTIAAVIAAVSLRLSSTLRPSHMGTVTNGMGSPSPERCR